MPKSKIYVGNLPFRAAREEIKSLFAQFGEVVDVTLPQNEDGKARGFGFVTFHKKEEAEAAIEKSGKLKLDNRTLRVNWANESGRRHTQGNERRQYRRQGEQQQANPSAQGQPNARFHNPYTFVPTPPRNLSHAFAKNANPLPTYPHDRLVDDLWTGEISIKIEVKTPLILIDTSKDPEPVIEGKKHKKYDCKPMPDASEIRGMLSNAYETITNSRYRGFLNEKKLGYRMQARGAAAHVPGQLKETSTGWKFELFTGESDPNKIDPTSSPSLMYAAWLDRYKKYSHRTTNIENDKHESEEACSYCDASGNPTMELPEHGDKVWFTYKNTPHGKFHFPKVTEIRKIQDGVPRPSGFNEGVVCITGRNMVNKHYERVFFNTHSPVTLDASEAVKDYKRLLKDYQELHEKDEEKRGSKKKMNDYLDHDPGKTGFSRHIWHGEQSKVQDGSLVYAKLTANGRGIETLFPVMISRKLYDLAPKDFLDNSLKPAETIDELSPADRLFGWVNQSAQKGELAAYRGRLRVFDVKKRKICFTEHTEPLPLNILGEPKPAYGGFYLGKDESGTPQDKGSNKEYKGYSNSAFQKGQKLRGRKYYWHHEKEAEYWNVKKQEDGWPDDRNFLRMKNEDWDDQNRSVTGWIDPESSFSVRIAVHNISNEELGALLYLCSLPDKHYHRMGYGKPLGFGSVRISIDWNHLKLAKGETWRKEYYSSFASAPPAKVTEKERDDLVESFMLAMIEAYPDSAKAQGQEKDDSKQALKYNPLEKLKHVIIDSGEDSDISKAKPDKKETCEAFSHLPFIAGFLAVARGPETNFPIHYPRKSERIDPDGRNFEWFSENERSSTTRRYNQPEGFRESLPSVTQDKGLPYVPSRTWEENEDR